MISQYAISLLICVQMIISLNTVIQSLWIHHHSCLSECISAWREGRRWERDKLKKGGGEEGRKGEIVGGER